MERISDYNVYTDGMRKSMADKSWFIDKIDGVSSIVDYGCADGALLQYIDEAFPNVFKLAGIDIDDKMLSQAKINVPIAITLRPDAFINFSSFDKEDACLNCGSVIHEVYSYGTEESIADFWDFVFNQNFKYIAIRDMAMSKIDEQKRRKKIESVLNAISVRNEKEGLNEEVRFKDFWQVNELDSRDAQWRDIVHYLLKYRYVANWSREVRENYLPLFVEEVLLKIPSDKYIVRHFEHYTLSFIKDQVYEDFGIDFNTKTHYKLLLERI